MLLNRERFIRALVRILAIGILLVLFLSYFAPLCLPSRIQTITGTCVDIHTTRHSGNKGSDYYRSLWTLDDGTRFCVPSWQIRIINKTDFEEYLPQENVTLRYLKLPCYCHGEYRVIGIEQNGQVYIPVKETRKTALEFWIFLGILYLAGAAFYLFFYAFEDPILYASRIKKQKKLKARAKAQKQQEREARRQARAERRHARKK